MPMTLENIAELISSGEAGLCDDSREIRPGDVFVAVKGVSSDGHDHIDEAFLKGARAVVCDDRYRLKNNTTSREIARVPDTREALGLLAKKKFKDPSKELSVYGVTGTNGKSTTISIIESVFSSMSIPCGITGTVFNKIRGEEFEPADMTTPGVLKLNGMLRDMADSGKKAAAVEMSSHALDQKRVSGIELEGAIFTNLTPEHMDYHKDMTRYLEAKLKIFENVKPGGIRVLNADSEITKDIAKLMRSPGVVTFGFHPESGVSCKNVNMGPDGSEFDMLFNGKNAGRVKSPLQGRHNISNALGAAALFLKKGFSFEKIIKGLENTRAVPGRLEKAPSMAPFRVYVDYAHTPDALKSALESVRMITAKKLFCVFGCGGDRDRQKRPVMGRIASEICDSLILTDDNPRKEDPDNILKEIERGILPDAEVRVIRDRRDAIFYAVNKAKEGDSVIIAGKGHENYQLFGDRIIHFDDMETVLSALREMGHGLPA
jgi:UDP-N-acetylmuramoyl-L-alanyl-D-glutamate--2,6-diaminopimelate ligase